MSTRFQPLYTTISSGGTVSATLAITGARNAVLFAPVVNSCELKVRASWDDVASHFLDLYGLDGTQRWQFDVEAGSKAMPLNDIDAVPYVRVETSVAQTDTRTFVFTVKF